MSGVDFIEIILSILELFAKSGEKGKTQDSFEKVKKHLQFLGKLNSDYFLMR